MYSDPADGIIVHQTESEIARLIDHTLLKPEASREDIQRLCEEAVDYGFASVCVNPWNVSQAVELIRGTEVRVCAVVGFPLGATLSIVKAFEAGEALKSGAQEIDMVINLGALKSGQEALAEADVRGVVDACHRAGALCKVILETALLTREEKVRGALLAKKAGADFIKTSTGFGPSGATAEDVRLIREAVGSGTGIKAAGGVRTLEEVRKMVEAGATRIGTSSGVKIIEELRGAKPASAESSGAGGKY